MNRNTIVGIIVLVAGILALIVLQPKGDLSGQAIGTFSIQNTKGQMSGRDLYKGIFFDRSLLKNAIPGLGPLPLDFDPNQLISRLETLAQDAETDAEEAVFLEAIAEVEDGLRLEDLNLSQAAGAITNDIHQEYPQFFQSFQDDIWSCDPNRIADALSVAAGITQEVGFGIVNSDEFDQVAFIAKVLAVVIVIVAALLLVYIEVEEPAHAPTIDPHSEDPNLPGDEIAGALAEHCLLHRTR